jgi:hypothetical protein
MKTIRLILGSIIVYLSVATLHACGTARSMTMGTGGHASSTTSGGGSLAAGGKGGAGGMASSGSMAGSGGKAGSGGAGGTGGIMNPVGDANAEESGSRLKAKRLVGEDGSKQFAGWYDTSLKVDCYYSLMQDGVKHCIPFTGASVSGFSDAACTVPLGAINVTGCAPGYAVQSANVTPTCADLLAGGTIYHVYPIIQPHSGPIYSKSGTTCSLAGNGPNLGSATYYDIGPESPPSTFVAGTVVQDP